MLDNLHNENYELKFTEYEKRNEKIRRERNRLLEEKKCLIRDIQKRERVLEMTETYLIQRIEKLKSASVSETAIHELEILLEALKEERHKIMFREVKNPKNN